MGWLNANGIWIGRNRGGGISLQTYWANRHPELKTYITGLTTPLSEAQIIKLGVFIEALKTGLSITNLSDTFDVMYIFAGETEESSLKNLVKNANHCTAVNAPTFTALEGFTGDGLSSYIDSNYNPSTVGNKFTLNDASIGIYIRTNNGLYSTNVYNIGVRDTSYVYIMGERSNGLMRATINSTTYNQPPFVGNVGLASYVRYGATSSYGYGNKTQSPEYTEASTSIPNGNVFILASSSGSNPAFYSKEQHSFAFAGKSITSAQINNIVDAIEAYMDANGKGVL
jgi:hypothetical protein